MQTLTTTDQHSRFTRESRSTLLVVGWCTLVWLACAISPWDFEAWLLEQFATLIGVAILAWCIHRHIVFTVSAKITLALLFTAHTIGTHYTYSETPYDSFVQALTGWSINDTGGWTRNHYDRFVHLMFGICLAMPTASVLQQRLGTSTFTSRFLGVHLIISISALYELVEWIAALIFGGELGMLYLGTQGDIWDAQMDISLAALGQLAVYGLYEASAAVRKISQKLLS